MHYETGGVRKTMWPDDRFLDDVEAVLERFDGPEPQRPDRAQARRLVQDLELLGEREPRLAERCYGLQARIYLKLQEFEQALLSVERAIALAPLDPGLVVLRGEIHQGADAYSSALRDFSEALERNPEAVTARMHRAEIQLAGGDPKAALADINDALRQEPRSARLLYRRGLILIDLRRAHEACADFQAAAQLATDPTLRGKAEKRLRELGIS
jgi:tetratricopeptide (TPR) repeat protein